MATKSKTKRKVAKKTRSKKTAKKTAKRTTSKTVTVLSKKKTKKPKNPTRLHLDEIEIETKTIERKRVTFICDSAADTYENYRKEIRKRERQIEKLEEEIKAKLAPIEKEIGVTKMKNNIKRLTSEKDALEENRNDFLLMVMGRLKQGCMSNIFRFYEKFKVGRVKYRAMSEDILCELLGVKKKSELFQEEFEKYQERHGAPEVNECLSYKNKEILEQAIKNETAKIKKAA